MSEYSGYQCEVIERVNALFYCKECGFIARRLTVSACCGESFCHSCIHDIHQQGKPCPECKQENFSVYEQKKFQQLIGALNAYCSMKERGCEWSGTVDQLDTHLDPTLDNCQYVDTKCPLNCQQRISKIKMEQHVAQECVNRPYVCQYFGYKVVDCPNLCGVNCDREDMEDHMKVCLKEEVECTFKGVGCKQMFKRECAEKHLCEYLSHHLSLTAAESVRMKEELVRKDIMLKKQDDKLFEQEQHIEALVHKNKLLSEKIHFLEGKLNQLLDVVYISNQFRSLQIKNFAYVTKDSEFSWQSPVMRTHTGAKFFIGVHRHDLDRGNRFVITADGVPVGYAVGKPVGYPKEGAASGVLGTIVEGLTDVLIGGKRVDKTICRLYATAHAIQGECDDDINWPLNVEIIIEIVKENEQNVRHIIRMQWKRPHQSYNELIRKFKSYGNVIQGTFNGTCMLGEISELKESSINGTLHIKVVGIKFHN